MENTNQIYHVYPIGYVKRKEGEVNLQILKEFHPALKELEKFSHAQIFWWFNQFDNEMFRKITTTSPPYVAPELGVFSTRSPIRPNPIALSTVKIKHIDLENGVIVVSNMDAFDDTPILDVKAYYPCCDRIENCIVGDWAKDWPEWAPNEGPDLD